MSWDDRRTVGGLGTVARQTAHSDDAKHRQDETSHLPTRPKWIAPVAVGAAVLLLGGGATAVALTASRGGDRHSSAGSRRSSSSTVSTSPATRSGRGGATGVAGRTFTLTGSMHTVVQAFHGPGQVVDHGHTFTFTCQDSSCTGTDLLGKPIELPAAGADEYLLVRHEHDPTINGTLNYVQTFRLTIHGTSATYVITVPKGAIIQRAYSADIAPPRTATLTAPMVFKS